MKEFNEILSKKLERMASIKYQVIEKSVTDDLNYGIRTGEKESVSSGIQVSKTGKEIKDSLQKEFAIAVEQKVSCFKEMDELVKEIGVNPESTFKYDYIANGWEGKIDLPKKYCYEEIYKDNNAVPQAKEMQKYNEHARKFIISSIECKKLQTIINYIDEKKTFKLTVDLASKLGF
jgi:hypothetical protein